MIAEGTILDWLRESDPSRLERLWGRADEIRREHVGDAVHLRGLVEISSHCVRSCAYCGLRASRRSAERYRLKTAEILECCRRARDFGCGTVVLQSGEDPGLTCEWVAALVRRIKDDGGLAVTLSLGERHPAELAAWREAGADRYLLRFETSDDGLYRRIHPRLRGQDSDRLALLRRLRGLGYEVGSGVMVGIPGQSRESLARDLQLFADLDLDMIGVGPFIAHPDTPLGAVPGRGAAAPEDAVPATVEMACKVVALARLVRPDANIPSTTALATLDPAAGRELGLRRGANVIMPVLTPAPHRAAYEVYPGKASFGETAEVGREGLEERILALGRRMGRGPGARRARKDDNKEAVWRKSC